VSPKELTAFRMVPEVMEALREVTANEGIAVAVHIDFAVRDWLEWKDVVHVAAARARTASRARSSASPRDRVHGERARRKRSA
jgi:hypothetical protein